MEQSSKRLIVSILYNGHNLIKGHHFSNDRIVGNAMQAMSIMSARKVDEVYLCDVSRSAHPDFDLIKKFTKDFYSPVTVGGCINSYEDFEGCLRSGADKVCIGSGFMRDSSEYNEDLIKTCVKKSGSQAVVASVDIYSYTVTSQHGRMEHNVSPMRHVETLESLGIGEIIFNYVMREGTLNGYCLDLIRDITNRVNIPVIASGGCSGYDDMRLAFEAGASGACAGALYQFTDCTPEGAATYLAEYRNP